MTSDDRKKLMVGAIVAALAFWAALCMLRQERVAADAGSTYATPAGAGSVGQIVVSLLVSLGGFVLTAGWSLVKSMLARFVPSIGGTAATASATDGVATIAAAKAVLMDAAEYVAERAAAEAAGHGLPAAGPASDRTPLMNAVQAFEDAVFRHYTPAAKP